jgi:ribulose kinase
MTVSGLSRREIEGVARDGVLPGFWCYEAGQAGFGDTLAWFVRTFPRCARVDENFAAYNAAAAHLRPGENHLVALDWWNGCRVPFGDSSLSGLIVGMNLRTSATGIYRALLESLCFGARTFIDHLAAGVVGDYADGSRQWSAKDRLHYRPRPEAITPYQMLYEQYSNLSQNAAVRSSMHRLNDGVPSRNEIAHD